jgi:N-acetylated-alpha-linked acidic dipeptidase
MKSILALLTSMATLAAQEPIRGFSQSEETSERALERKAIGIPEASRQKTYLERMAKVPHHAGSAASEAVAEYALGLFKEFGLDAHIENYEALIPYPTARSLEMVSPVKFRASLKEPALSQDPYTSNPT